MAGKGLKYMNYSWPPCADPVSSPILFIQAVPQLVAEKKVICTNASDSSFHLLITHIFVHSKVSMVEVFLRVMNTTKEVD